MLKQFSDLVGQVLDEVKVEDEQILFFLNTGEIYMLYHNQDCCESVFVDDVNGDVNALLNSPIVMAEEATSDTNPDDYVPDKWGQDSFTWTFYKLATANGVYVTIRWYGESNGYYSESVDWEYVGNRG